MAELKWSQEPTQPNENNGGAAVDCNKSTGNPTEKIPVSAKDGKEWSYPSPKGK